MTSTRQPGDRTRKMIHFGKGVMRWAIILVLCSFLFSGILGAH